METSLSLSACVRALSASFHGTSPGDTATMCLGCGSGSGWVLLLCTAMPSASAPPEEKPQLCGLLLVQITPCKRCTPALRAPAGHLPDSPLAGNDQHQPSPWRQPEDAARRYTITLYCASSGFCNRRWKSAAA